MAELRQNTHGSGDAAGCSSIEEGNGIPFDESVKALLGAFVALCWFRGIWPLHRLLYCLLLVALKVHTQVYGSLSQSPFHLRRLCCAAQSWLHDCGLQHPSSGPGVWLALFHLQAASSRLESLKSNTACAGLLGSSCPGVVQHIHIRVDMVCAGGMLDWLRFRRVVTGLVPVVSNASQLFLPGTRSRSRVLTLRRGVLLFVAWQCA
jgi:hypothetical protein